MSGGVDQVQLIDLTVRGFVWQSNGLSFDSDAALALDIHAIEELIDTFAIRQSASELEDAVGKGAFAVIDMGDDGEVTDLRGRRGHGPDL